MLSNAERVRAARRRRRRRGRGSYGALAAGLLVALVPLTGCTSSEKPVDVAMAASTEEVSATPLTVREQLVAFVVGAYASPEDVSEGNCFADAVLARVDEAELVAAEVLIPGNVDGMLPRVPDEMVEPWVEAQFDCTDYIKQATRAQTFATNGRIDPMAYSACYGRKITEDVSKRATRSALSRDWKGEAWQQVRAAVKTCLAEAQPDG